MTRPRTDFFEFYWHHRVRDTTVPQVTAWLKALATRRIKTVPSELRAL